MTAELIPESAFRVLRDIQRRIIAMDARIDGLGDEIASGRSEMTAFRIEVKSEIAGVKSEIAEVRSEMAGLCTEVKSEMATLRIEVKSEMDEVRTEVKRVYIQQHAIMGNHSALIDEQSERLDALEQPKEKE